jgi:hypothetical protein
MKLYFRSQNSDLTAWAELANDKIDFLRGSHGYSEKPLRNVQFAITLNYKSKHSPPANRPFYAGD